MNNYIIGEYYWIATKNKQYLFIAQYNGQYFFYDTKYYEVIEHIEKPKLKEE